MRINSYAHVEESILFDNVNVGRYCRIRRAIIDKDVVIPEKMEIGFNAEADKTRGLILTEGGVAIVPKGHTFRK